MSRYSPMPEGRKPEVRCAECPIAHKAVCSYSQPAELSLLEAIKSYRTYGPGEEILATGEASANLGSVVAGTVALSRLMADGRRQMVGLLFPGDFVGRALQPVATYDATAVDEVTLCLFDRRRFEKLMGDSPDLRRKLLEMTLDELDAAREWMVILGRKTAREKIASFLGILVQRARQGTGTDSSGPIRVSLPLTREAMADYLGLTIETVSRQIGALKKDRLIVLEDLRTVLIPDPAALRAEAGDDE